jgi:D-glycero-alpha-D-manno-heptose-7-phosphate kinase
MRTTRARAPVRLDLAGGTLDIWPLYLTLPPPAVTVNVALDLPATAEVVPHGTSSDSIRLESRDRERTREYASLDALREELAHNPGGLPLLARAVAEIAEHGGFTLRTAAGSPVGAGLGGSSALLIAVLSALTAAFDAPRDTEALRRAAQDLEAWVLRAPTGYQDYYPPLLGGCLALEGCPGAVIVERLSVDLDALRERCILVYTGAPHASGLTNWGVLRAYLDGERDTVDALHAIADIARETREHLRRGDLDAALATCVREGAVRRRLAPGVTTPAIERIDEQARRAGALGTKIMGAGGGGCVLILLRDPGDRAAVTASVRDEGVEEIPLRIAADGVRVDVEDET